MISTITSTQVYKQIRTIVRKSMTHLFIYRLRNYGDLEAIVEELSAIYGKRALLQIYHEAVSEEHSFLYVNLMSKYKTKMFMTRFNHYLNPSQCFICILLYKMTTLTSSEGKVLTYTNGFIETFLLHVSSRNNYYTTGDGDILFIKIGSNTVLVLEYTYRINRNIFLNFTINENSLQL